MNLSKSIDNLNKNIESIKFSLMENNILLKENLINNQEHQYIFKHGIHGYKEKIKKDLGITESEKLKNNIQILINQYPSLRHPHIKILQFLSNQFDFKTNSFKEIHFSKIVKECRLGKNKAKDYFEFLIQRNLIKFRTDGYRKFYRFNFN